MVNEQQKQQELCSLVAGRVCQLLEDKGLSQKDLARLMGKTETEVSRWLSGTHNLTMGTIAKIALALGDDIVCTTVSKPYIIDDTPIGGMLQAAEDETCAYAQK